MTPAFLFLALSVCAPALKVPDEPPAVAELFEDDAEGLIAKLAFGGDVKDGEAKATAEKKDVFTGKTAVRVSPAQRFHHDVNGWAFPIAENPKAGEYRYLRFAWKKAGAGPIMFQLCARQPKNDWLVRYHAGKTEPPWPAIVLRPAAPAEWQVVTRDLFKDFGELTIGGIGLSPLTGGDGLFDHILLGRTVADLDRATAAALLKDAPRPQTEAGLRQLWLDLAGADALVADTAVWGLLSARKDAVPYLAKTVAIPPQKAPPAEAAKARPLIAQLNHERQAIRDAATDELLKLGDGMLPMLRAAIAAADGEEKARLTAALAKRDAKAPPDEIRLRRCLAVLRAADTPEARELLAKIEKALP